MKKIFLLIFTLLFSAPSFATPLDEYFTDPFVYKFVESYYLNKYSGILKKSDSGYEVTARDGTKVSIKNNDNGEPDLVIHNFLKPVEGTDYFLFLVSYYEDWQFLMVRISDGKQFYIPDLPHVSPDKKRLVAVSFKESGEYDVVKIYKITENGWQNVLAENETFPEIKQPKQIEVPYTEQDIEELRASEALAFSMVQQSRLSFEFVSDKLKDNENFVDKCISIGQNYNQKMHIIEHASERLRNGRYQKQYDDLVYMSVIASPSSIKNYSDKYKDNEEFVDKIINEPAIKNDNSKLHLFLRNISLRLRSGTYKELYRDVAFEWARYNNGFMYADEILRDDEEFVRKILSITKDEDKPKILPYISDRLRKEKFD